MRRIAVILVALAAGVGRVEAQMQCSVLDQNTFVRDTLREMYLWYDRLPDLDPALVDSPEGYLDAVRLRPEDETFSYITSAAESTAFYSESQFVGIGFSMRPVGESRLRVTQVFPESPASEAGLARGDYLTAVGGRSVEELLATGELDFALGPSEIGVTLELAWRSQFGEERSAVVVKRPVTIPTVSQKEVIDLEGLPVGYLHLRNFVEPSLGALDTAFAEFRARGVTDVILDLRYNGGGLIEVARHLGSLIGGSRTTTQPFVELVHNDKNTFRNRTFRFDDPEERLDLPRLVVITTRASASASELVIQGLKPFIAVTVVGDRTYGKPVGQYGFEFCDKMLFPVSFRSRNAAGETDFFDGIPANCPAADNLDRALGDPAEASLAEGLYFLRRGQCSASSQREGRALALEVAELPLGMRSGFSRLLNAW
ncbi:MAG: S41 family peptidase [Vicinamibacteria bacterium]